MGVWAVGWHAVKMPEAELAAEIGGAAGHAGTAVQGRTGHSHTRGLSASPGRCIAKLFHAYEWPSSGGAPRRQRRPLKARRPCHRHKPSGRMLARSAVLPAQLVWLLLLHIDTCFRFRFLSVFWCFRQLRDDAALVVLLRPPSVAADVGPPAQRSASRLPSPRSRAPPGRRQARMFPFGRVPFRKISRASVPPELTVVDAAGESPSRIWRVNATFTIYCCHQRAQCNHE